MGTWPGNSTSWQRHQPVELPCAGETTCMEYSAKFVPIDLVQIPVFGPGISTCQLNCWDWRNLVNLPVSKWLRAWYNVAESEVSQHDNFTSILVEERKVNKTGESTRFLPERCTA